MYSTDAESGKVRDMKYGLRRGASEYPQISREKYSPPDARVNSEPPGKSKDRQICATFDALAFLTRTTFIFLFLGWGGGCIPIILFYHFPSNIPSCTHKMSDTYKSIS